MKIHELKTWPEYYQDVIDGKKKVEIRKNDRNFSYDIALHLREYDPSTQEYTGRDCICEVTNIIYGGKFGLEKGYLAMSIKVVMQYSED